MIVEYHAIQSFAPANLNRDDAGVPKSCTFGGVLRARVSSQSWKRAIRMRFVNGDFGLATGLRTKRAHQAIVDRLTSGDVPLDEDRARHRAAVVLEAEPIGVGLVIGDDQNESSEIKTKQLIFFREEDLDVLADVAREFGEEIDKLPSSVGGLGDGDSGAEKDSSPKRGKKERKKISLPKEAADRIKEILNGPGRTADVALFGRMLAELPTAKVEASCQVAHAIGTHRLAAEHDFYTAVDDRKPDDNEGADMMGVIEYNASCLYRYAALDLGQLAENLGSTAAEDEVQKIVAAFTEAFALAVPSGKQNSFAAHNPPNCLLVTARESGAWNLANAFADPVDGSRSDGGIVKESVERMRKQLRTIEGMFGSKEAPLRGKVLSEFPGLDWGPTIEQVDNLEAITAWNPEA